MLSCDETLDVEARHGRNCHHGSYGLMAMSSIKFQEKKGQNRGEKIIIRFKKGKIRAYIALSATLTDRHSQLHEIRPCSEM